MEKVIVTGANGSLGKHVVRHLHDKGYFIEAVTGRSGNGFEDLENVNSSSIDLMDKGATDSFIRNVVEKHQRINHAVLLVGGFSMGKISSVDWQDIEQMINLNFKTAFTVVRPLFEHIKESGGGRIILIGSRPAIDPDAGKNMIAYALSKSLVFRLAEMLNAAGNEHNIVASVIVPSIIDTTENREAMSESDFSKWVPPSSIAETIGFLLSETGQKLREPVVKIYNRS